MIWYMTVNGERVGEIGQCSEGWFYVTTDKSFFGFAPSKPAAYAELSKHLEGR